MLVLFSFCTLAEEDSSEVVSICSCHYFVNIPENQFLHSYHKPQLFSIFLFKGFWNPCWYCLSSAKPAEKLFLANQKPNHKFMTYNGLDDCSLYCIWTFPQETILTFIPQTTGFFSPCQSFWNPCWFCLNSVNWPSDIVVMLWIFVVDIIFDHLPCNRTSNSCHKLQMISILLVKGIGFHAGLVFILYNCWGRQQ